MIVVFAPTRSTAAPLVRVLEILGHAPSGSIEVAPREEGWLDVDWIRGVPPPLCFGAREVEVIRLLVHRDPIAVARELRADHASPLIAGLALWERAVLDAARGAELAPRAIVGFAALSRDPRSIAGTLARFLALHGVSSSTARIHELAPGPADPPTSHALLTAAQRALYAQLDAGRWPEAARGPAHAPPDAERLASAVGRSRASAWHAELREQNASARMREVASERARVEAELVELRRAHAIERARLTHAEERELGRQWIEGEPVGDVEDRLDEAGRILRHFERRLFREWTATEGAPYAGLDAARPLRVLVGTLSSGENELDQCIASVRRQSYREVEHRVFRGLGKKESIATLMRTFQESDADLLLKLDADMVLTAPDFIERVVRVFQARPELDLLQMALLDFFSGGPIQGINVYRRTAAWSAEQQDVLFTDRAQVPAHKRLVVWPTFARDALHAPDPSPFQAFHFGVHRGVKVLQPHTERHAADRALEQLAYLEKTWRHMKLRRDRRLALACLGHELALHGRYSVRELDYTNPSLKRSFAAWEHLDVDALEVEVERLRATPVVHAPVERLRAHRAELAPEIDPGVRTIVALLPHTRVYGGVNRFFEVAREMGRLGVRCAIARPDGAFGGPRPEYPDVELLYYSEALTRRWDVVLCGDAFGGVMLTMPLFLAKTSAVYLLNGWGKSPLNWAQITIVDPDVVIANSSFSAAQYPGLAPVVVPGGVDLEVFHPRDVARSRTDRFKLCAYPGRRKSSKRFEDTVDACTALHHAGIPVELHAFDQDTLWLDAPFPFVFHGALDKQRVRELLWEMDAMVCAEEDGGWSNPAAEAMASGTPLICTDAGTLDFAIHEETALVVPRRDPRAIAAAVERLYRDPALAQRLRAAGLERIRAFGWSSVARNLCDVLATVRPDPDGRAIKNARARERLVALGGI